MSDDFGAPLPALTPRERRILVAVSVVVALSRMLSVARSPWDWDEILFALGLREFDVTQHHPHPPGFPLFILSAKIFRLFGLSDFRSLQSVNIIASIALLPVAFFCFREMRFRFPTAMTGAVILAFMPNVWFFGGTAFSDVPSMVLLLAASGLLLRGSRSGTSYVMGAAVLGIAAGYRPQNLMIGAVPALIATAYQLKARSFRRVAVAIVAGAIITAASYVGAAMATGSWSSYTDAIRVHREYIARTDSFRSPIRPSLEGVADDFFLRPFRASGINWLLGALVMVSVAISIVRLRRPVLIALASFLPFWIMAWLVLDYHSTSRFSIAWMPLVAILVADAIWLIAPSTPRLHVVSGVAMTAALTLALVVWTLPALAVVRREDSPPIQAVEWIRERAGHATKLYVHKSMAPYISYFLSSYRAEVVDGPPVARLGSAPALYITERPTAGAPRREFRFERGTLWNVVRRRYFVVSIVGLTRNPDFQSGWYDEESSGSGRWRWMGGRSVTLLPPTRRPVKLLIDAATPHGLSGPPQVTITLNGVVLDRFTASQNVIERSYDVSSRTTPNDLIIETDRVVNPRAAGLNPDSRDLGLRVERLEWIAVDP